MIFLIDIFWFGVIAIISYRMPAYVDDYLHQKSFVDGRIIEHISQIIPSVASYYNSWGGRAVSMFFIQLMLMLPKIIFSLCNGAFFIATSHVIYKFAAVGKKENKIEPFKLGLIYLFLWFFMPDFSEVLTWPTGAITYLWTNLALLVFGYIYYRDYHEKNEKTGIRNTLVYMILGFLAGQSNEAGASTMIFAMIIFVFLRLKNKEKIHLNQILGIVSLIIGTATLILAPGNRIRVSTVETASDVSDILRNYIFRIGRETFYGIMFLMIPLAICVGLYVAKNSKSWRDKQILFFLLAFASIYVMTFSAGFASRIYQLPLLLLGVAFSISLNEIADSEIYLKAKRGIAAFIAIMMIMAVFEIVAGAIYSKSKESFFDRQTIYYHIYDTEGALSGNGIQN